MITMPRFPPRSPGGSRSRDSTVLSRHYDFLTSFSPPFVSFGWRYHPFCRWLRLSTETRHGLRARRFGCGTPLEPRFGTETAGSPKFLGNPHCPSAHVLRPRSAACVSPKRRCTTAPATGNTRAPALVISELNSMALGFAVYASQRGLPRRRARLASSRWLNSPGRASTRRVPARGFRSASYITTSSPKLCLARSRLIGPRGICDLAGRPAARMRR